MNPDVHKLVNRVYPRHNHVDVAEQLNHRRQRVRVVFEAKPFQAQIRDEGGTALRRVYQAADSEGRAEPLPAFVCEPLVPLHVFGSAIVLVADAPRGLGRLHFFAVHCRASIHPGEEHHAIDGHTPVAYIFPIRVVVTAGGPRAHDHFARASNAPRLYPTSVIEPYGVTFTARSIAAMNSRVISSRSSLFNQLKENWGTSRSASG